MQDIVNISPFTSVIRIIFVNGNTIVAHNKYVTASPVYRINCFTTYRIKNQGSLFISSFDSYYTDLKITKPLGNKLLFAIQFNCH